MNKKQITVFGLASVTLTLQMMLSGGSSALAATFGNDSLQNLFDDITISGPGIDTVNDQTGYDVFTNTATGNSTSSLMFEFAEGDPNSKFGIYNRKKPGEKVQLFGGSNYSGASSTVRFTGSQIGVTTWQIDPNSGEFVLDPLPSFQSYDYSWNKFGFYLEKADGTTLYTQDALNGGYQQAVIYEGDDETVLDLPGRRSGTFTDNEFIIAFEDEWLGGVSDSDYDNFVVMVESVEPVPEPGTIAGLGLVAVSLLATRRRKS
ncbi:MAG: PEP-CTERM sorting domain-containing protein [Hormoscilla sp.]